MKIQSSLRALSVLALTIALLFGPSLVPANAYTLIGHKLIYGVGGPQHYWIDSSASSHISQINDAAKNWSNTSTRIGVRTPIYYTRTTTKGSSRMDIYKDKNINSWCGQTTFWVKNTAIDPAKKNWVYGKIELDGDFNGSDCTNRHGIISHEMGHVMGLDHVSAKSSVMYTYVGETKVKWAVKDDCNGINRLY